MTHPNNILTEEELDQVNECAGRLRLIQSDFGALAPGKRLEYLQEEISRSFKDFNSANQQRLLTALLARFPLGGQVATSVREPVPIPVAAAPRSAAGVLEELLGMAGSMPPDQKTEFAKKLYQAGFGWVDKEALELEVSEQVGQRLGIQPGKQPRLDRMVELVTQLVQTLHDLDRTGLLTLRELCPRSSLLNRPKDFRYLAGQYLTGEAPEIEAQIRMASTLLGGMLAAMLGGGRDFGRQYTEKYSPAAIEDVVAGEGRSAFLGPGKKERCWDKYNNLSKDIATPELMDRWVKDCLGKFVDSRTKLG